MSFSKHIKELNRHIISNTPEFLGQNVQYKLDKHLNDYTTDLTQAYTLLQGNINHASTQVYALISKLPQVINFTKFLAFYHLDKIDNFLNIIDYGCTKINNKESFGIILPYIPSEKLIKHSLHLFENKSDIVLQYIIMPILEVIIQLHNMNLTHGCLNQDNIWLEFDSNYTNFKVTVSNTALEISGFSQYPACEPLNRMLVHKSGKDFSKTADCYAIGVLIISLISGNNVTRKSYESILLSKSKLGSYQAIMNSFGDDNKLDRAAKYVAYWLLHDDESKRWTAQQAIKFLRRRYRRITIDNISKCTKKDVTTRQILKKPLKIFDEECVSLMEAAVLSIRHYDDIKIKVKNGKLIKALLHHQEIKPDFISKVSHLRNIVTKFDNVASQNDMFLTSFIILLNQYMPIKTRDFAVEPNAIWQMSKYLINKPYSIVSQTLHDMLYNNTISKIYQIITSLCNIKVNFTIPEIRLLSCFTSNSINYFMYNYLDYYSVYFVADKICFSVEDCMTILNTLSLQDFILEIQKEYLLCTLLGKLVSRNVFQVYSNCILNPYSDEFARIFLILSLCYEICNNQSYKQIASHIYNKYLNNYINQILCNDILQDVNISLKKAVEAGDISKMYHTLCAEKIDTVNQKFIDTKKHIKDLSQTIESFHTSVNDNVLNDARDYTIKIVSTLFVCILIFIFYKLL